MYIHNKNSFCCQSFNTVWKRKENPPAFSLVMDLEKDNLIIKYDMFECVEYLLQLLLWLFIINSFVLNLEQRTILLPFCKDMKK